MPVFLDPVGHDLTAAAFVIRVLSGALDPADDNDDGVPDAIRFFHAGSLRSAAFRPPGTLSVALADISPTPRLLAPGKLLEITVDPLTGIPPAYLVEVESYGRSFGSADGRSVSGGLEPSLFWDGFESGTLGAWSKVSP